VTIQQRKDQGKHCSCQLCKPHKHGLDVLWGKGSFLKYQPRFMTKRILMDEMDTYYHDLQQDELEFEEFVERVVQQQMSRRPIRVYSKQGRYLQTLWR